MRCAAVLVSALALSACAGGHSVAPAPPPARVAVTFTTSAETGVLAEGFADRAGRRVVTADDPARIASVSKLVVALGVMRMVEAGTLDLDRDVSDYLGWRLRNPHLPGEPVTLRLLLSHRAGLRDDADYVIPLGDSLKARLARPEAWAPPGRDGAVPFAYGNINFPVIASVMERTSGERFDRLMARLVFAPLGIDACFNWTTCTQGAAARAVVLHGADGAVRRDDLGGVRPACPVVAASGGNCELEGYVPGSNGSLFSPQGGLRISARGLARLGQMLLRGGEGFLTPASILILRDPLPAIAGSAPHFCHYGLAVQTLASASATCSDDLFPDTVVRYGHAGEAYGLRSGLWLDPVAGTGIAYFVTAVPDKPKGEEGGFAPEERDFVARALKTATR